MLKIFNNDITVVIKKWYVSLLELWILMTSEVNKILSNSLKSNIHVSIYKCFCYLKVHLCRAMKEEIRVSFFAASEV